MLTPSALMWYDDDVQTLKDVAAEASTSTEWADYVGYCTERERGLLRQASTVLERFILQMERASFAQRRRFVSWLLHWAELWEGSHLPERYAEIAGLLVQKGVDMGGVSHLLAPRVATPRRLRKRIIEPTLAEWIQVEPNSSEPHRWLGGYEHLKQAIELDPSDQLARRKFIACILGNVRYFMHEGPQLYLGNPVSDLAALAEAEAAAAGLPNEDDRSRASAEISGRRKGIENYLNGCLTRRSTEWAPTERLGSSGASGESPSVS